MVEYSLIEFGVYGFIAYGSFLMLMISTIKEVPHNDSLAVARVIYLIPGIICAMILAGSGEMITWTTTETTIDNDIVALGKMPGWDQNFTESAVISTDIKIQLQEPIWILVHYLLAIILVVYVITQILHLLGIQSHDHTK